MTTYYYEPVTGYLNGIEQPLVGTTTYSNFDPLGNPQTVTDPNGNSTTYTYDTIGRVATVKAPGDTAATQYYYVAGGCGQSCSGANKIDHITLPEGNTIWYTYDSMGNLSTITDSLNNSISYVYDSEGNRLKEEIRDSASVLQKTLSYQYDALNRVAKIVNPDSAYTQYTYDNLGNRKSLKDPNGNTTTYSYDALNRLSSVIQPGTVTTTYGYNSNSNLTSVIDANNNTTTYKYDDKGRVYQTISPDTGTTTYHNDHLGTPQKMTDSSGTVVWAADFKPFGEATITVSTITNNLRFPGQYYDAETGLHYNYYRDYNPVIGRYVESDPLGIQGGMNHLYVYADNDPINFTDPDGLCPATLDFGWTYKMVGPNKATDYQYQRQEKERRVGKLTYASGKCDCQNKTLQCNYDIFESWYSRTRSYNKKTKQYGTWGTWAGYDDKLIGAAIIEYNCKDQSYKLHGGMTF